MTLTSLQQLLRADPVALSDWLKPGASGRASLCLGIIFVGAGVFGAALGGWRDALQALYTGIKLPLVIVSTTLGNGILNGLLAPLLGMPLSLRQSLMVVLMTFAITSLVLGALSPVAVFVMWNTPPLTAATTLVSPEYGFLQLMLVAFIALAGTIGNVALLPLLRRLGGSRTAARKVLLAWLAGNLLLGSQICWLLRPFLWDPARPVEFIGPEYWRGSFFETLSNAARRLLLP